MCLANRPGFAMGVNPSVRQQPTLVRFGRPALSTDRGTPVQAPATPDLTSPSSPPLRISPSTFSSPGGQSTGSITDAVRSVGATPGLNGSTPAMAPGAAKTSRTGPLPAPKAPVPRPRNTAILDAGSDGALILQQVRQGLVAPVDAAQRFQDMLGSRNIKPGNKGKLMLSFGEGLARAAQQRAAMQRAAQAARPAPAASNVPPAAASPTQRRNEVSAVRARIIDGVEVLDAVGGADLTRSPHLLATSLSDTLPSLDVDRIEQLRRASENDPVQFNNRLVATINDAALRARALTQSSAPSAPGLMRGALARAFGMAIAAASVTGDQRFIDAVLERTEGLPGTGGFRGLANIGRNLLAENSGAPLPARVIANQMLQVHAQQLVLQAGTQVGAADPLAIFLGVGGSAVSAAQRLGTGVASTASRTAPQGTALPTRPAVNNRDAVNRVFSNAGPGGGRVRFSGDLDPPDAVISGMRKRFPRATGDTIAAARTDIPGLEQKLFDGFSPIQRRRAGKPPLVADRNIQSPYKNGGFDRHAEEDILNSVDQAIRKAGLVADDLKGKTLSIVISRRKGVCDKCYAGLKGLSGVDTPGAIKLFSKLYPTLTIRIRVAGGHPAVRNKAKILTVRDQEWIPE